MEGGKSGACSRMISAQTAYIEAAAAKNLFHSFVLFSRVAETGCFVTVPCWFIYSVVVISRCVSCCSCYCHLLLLLLLLLLSVVDVLLFVATCCFYNYYCHHSY